MAELIKGYFRRGGLSILSSGVFVKLVGLLMSAYLARMVSPESFGHFTYALLVVCFIRPVVTEGFSRSYLRFGALLTSAEQKSRLLAAIYSRGLMATISVWVVLLAVSAWICKSNSGSLPYFWILAFLLIGEYFISLLGSHFRINHWNRKYALIAVYRTLIQAGLAIVGVYFFGAIGYAVATISALLFAFLVMGGPRLLGVPKFRGSPPLCNYEGLKSFLYFVSLSATVSGGAFIIDGIVLGNVLKDPAALAQYRIATLLPVSLMILPKMFFTAEYVYIAENYQNKIFIKHYLKQYMLLFAMISLTVLLFVHLLGEWIVVTIFSEKYVAAVPLLKILSFGICGAYILRQPFGILLNSSGRADLNLFNGVATLLITTFTIVWLVPRLGLNGAAIATSISLWLSGILACYCYYFFVYRKL